jgi:hypothetical protein
VSKRSRGWAFGSTHPSPVDRAQKLEEYIAKKGLSGRTDGERTDRFMRKTAGVRR